jgi:hypothetical protein
MEQHKIELLQNSEPIETKQRRWNPKNTTMVKEELDKLLEAGFIRLVEINSMGFSYGIGVKENWQAKGMCQLQSFKQSN